MILPILQEFIPLLNRKVGNAIKKSRMVNGKMIGTIVDEKMHQHSSNKHFLTGTG